MFFQSYKKIKKEIILVAKEIINNSIKLLENSFLSFEIFTLDNSLIPYTGIPNKAKVIK